MSEAPIRLRVDGHFEAQRGDTRTMQRAEILLGGPSGWLKIKRRVEMMD